MQTLSEIRSILAERGLRPKHRLGQNFLHDKNILSKLVEAADISPGELVLEIGPGTGTLTETLIEKQAQLIACELDASLADIIQERLGGKLNLIIGDCLDSHRKLSADIITALVDHPFKLIANLPYQVASPLMCTLLLEHPSCTGQYITIQKEVAQRLLAKPSTKEYGPLTIIVGALADVKRICTIKPTCFWPQPKVESAMISIIPKSSHKVNDPNAFARFVTELFTKRRKQLGSILGKDIKWPNGVTADLRPEALSIGQMIELVSIAT